MAKTEANTIQLRVTINGTDVNPYEKLGLKQNPFSQLGKMEYDFICRKLNLLEATPMKSADELRAWLQKERCTKEFIDLCVQHYRKGQTTRFYITFPA